MKYHEKPSILYQMYGTVSHSFNGWEDWGGRKGNGVKHSLPETHIEHNFLVFCKLLFSYKLFMFVATKICFSYNNTFCNNNEILRSFSSPLLDSTSSPVQAQLATKGPWCQIAEDILVAVTNSLLVGCAECCSGSSEVVYVSVTWLGYRKSRWFDFFFSLWRTLF